MTKERLLIVALLCAAPLSLCGQEMNPTSTQRPQQPVNATEAGDSNIPLYKIQVVARDIPAINYWHRKGSTRIGFVGTSLLPQGKGEADVTSNGPINARFQGFVPANSFGVEYLTYVLWAITPQGRPVNLGELQPSGSKFNISTKTSLQQFALIVTAEPYYAVTTPSDLVVMENTVNKDKTTGIIESVNAHFSLLPKGTYTEIAAGQRNNPDPVKAGKNSPLELYQAINAVQYAEANGAAKYSPDIFGKAKQELENAEAMNANKKAERYQMITIARGAVQDAEDARIDTLRKKQEEEKRKQQEAVVKSQQEAQEAQMAAQQAQMSAQQEALQRAQADAQRAQAEAAAANARAAQAAAEHTAQQATNQTEEMREKLRSQLSQVLQTQETARGLIVNLSDVLFDTAQYTLKADAREKLAKVSGILLAYPDLKVQVEGYTDTVGSDEYNLTLSQHRADAVRAYLVSQGVNPANTTAMGYGKSNPVADNGTSAGRAQNRRVNLVVSGAAIGVQQSAPAEAPAMPSNPQGTSNPPTQ